MPRALVVQVQGAWGVVRRSRRLSCNGLGRGRRFEAAAAAARLAGGLLTPPGQRTATHTLLPPLQITGFDKLGMRHTIEYEDGDTEIQSLWAPNQMVNALTGVGEFNNGPPTCGVRREKRTRAGGGRGLLDSVLVAAWFGGSTCSLRQGPQRRGGIRQGPTLTTSLCPFDGLVAACFCPVTGSGRSWHIDPNATLPPPSRCPVCS